MKKISVICAAICMLLSTGLKASQAGDWRQGIWNRDVSENLLSLNIEAIPVITEAYKNTTPWAAGFNAAFEHKMRPSIIHGKGSVGYGGHLGISRYFGKNINTSVTGHNLDQTWDKYKSFTEIPIMLDVNFYLNFSRSNLFIGFSGGINLMLGQKDAALSSIGPSITSELEESYLSAFGKEVDIISIQQDANNVSLTHVVPTLRAHLGYMWEITPDFRFKIQVGIEYQMKYADEYSGFHIDANYIPYYHKHDSPQMLNPFVSIGLVYSL